MLLKTWEFIVIQRYYAKRRVLAQVIGTYGINDRNRCSCVTQELRGNGRWSRSLSVSRPLAFQKAILSHSHFCSHWRAGGSSGWDVLGHSPHALAAGGPGAQTAAETRHSIIPLHLSPAPSFPACFNVSAQIDCGTFIASSVPLQQGILCCEFIAGLCSSLSYLIGQSSCNMRSSQHSCTGSRCEQWAESHPASVMFSHNKPL